MACSTLSSAVLSCRPFICSDTLDDRIAVLERRIEEVEADINKAEGNAGKAKVEGDTEELKFWRNKETQLRNKETQLRNKETQLRDEKARKEQQGSPLCSPLNCCFLLHGRASPTKTSRPGSIMMVTVLPLIC